MITIEELTTQRILFFVHGDTETQRKNLALCEIKDKKRLRVSVSLCTKYNKHKNK